MHTNMQNEGVTYNIEYWQIYQQKKKDLVNQIWNN